MALSEKHARPAYIMVDDPVGLRAFRLVSLDPKLEATRVFDTLGEVFRTFSANRSVAGHNLHQGTRPGLEGATRREADVAPAVDPTLTLPIIAPLFGKSGRGPSAADMALLRQLSLTMYGAGPEGLIPAGYAYLGQFIAHEICRAVHQDGAGAGRNGQTFAFDLDSLYTNAPKNGLRLEIGKTTFQDAPFDILRAPSGCPITGNPRNDSNVALSQMHCAFMRYHNALAGSGLFTTFADIEAQVILTAQSITLNDWLPRLTSRTLVDSILAGTRFTPAGEMHFCPAEAALVALRHGHSMVRQDYLRWNATIASAASVTGMLTLTFDGGGLENGELPWIWPVDWRGFFVFDHEVGNPMRAMQIDTWIEPQLATMPSHLFDTELQEASLAYRTLSFGAIAQIKDGWEVQALLSAALGPAEFPMTPADLTAGRPDLQPLFGPGAPLADHPPLWWFILREAERFSTGGGLTGVGARLLAETIVAAIETSTPSILNGDVLHPALPGGGSLPPTMSNLLSWGGQKVDWYRAELMP